MTPINIKEIVLAGGCFWGTQSYFKNIIGVIDTEVGYANGNCEETDYQAVCDNLTNHAEVVKIIYDNNIINLEKLLEYYYQVIDPTSLNKQGNDIGQQYRTGIYYINESDILTIRQSLKELQNKYRSKIVVECLPLLNYCKAEEHHQDYLDKNPNGYCHISKELIDSVR